jgi:AbiTii
MPPVILQLQQDALDRAVPASDLLRKALVVAKKLGLAEFEQWVTSELGGYKGSEVPAYREVTGQIRGWNPYRGWIPLVFEDTDFGEKMSRRKTHQAVPEMEHLLASGNSTLQMPFPQSVQSNLSRNGFGFETQVTLMISSGSLVGIVETVRTIVLNWALKLESEGILGEGLSFTTQEKSVAKQTPQVVTNFFGTVNSPQIQQANETAVQIQTTMDVAQIKKLADRIAGALPQLQLSPDHEAEVKAELATIEAQVGSPKPKRGVITESLRSLRTVLEGAAGGAAGQLLVDLGKALSQ